MKLEKLNIYHVRIPLVSHFETSFGRVENQDTVIVEAHAGGAVGYGESPAGAAPYFCSEDVHTCLSVISRHIFPLLCGVELQSAAQVFPTMKRIRGNNIAKAGVETSLWDLFAKQKAKSLAALMADELGLGSPKHEVPAGISLGIQDSVSQLLEKIDAASKKGYTRIKVKIKPGWDYDVLKQIRQNFPEVSLWADANAAYTLKDLGMLRSFDEFNLGLLEQPFDYSDLLDHKELQQQMTTRICLDESIHSPRTAEQAIALGACRVINVKVSRIGGHLQSILTARIANRMGTPLWVGGMLETGVGRAHNVAMASLPTFVLPNDISETARYYVEDIATPHFRLNSNGTISMPAGAGVGVEVDPKLLKKFTIAKLELKR